MSGQSTVVESSAVSLPSFDVVTEPVLLIVAQLACVVGLVMCTFLEAPPASTPQLQVSVPLAMEQPRSDPAESMVHDRPALAGSRSVTVTSRASPAPLFFAVIVKPIGDPALTDAESAVLVR